MDMKKLLCIVLAMLCMCSAAFAAETRMFFAMDTYMSISAPDAPEALVDECVAAINGLEADISVTDPGSGIYALNSGGSAALDGHSLRLTEFALEMCALTGGALDITMYPVVRAWGFTTGEYTVPETEEIAALLSCTGYSYVTVKNGCITLPEGFMLDLGSVAKGYASDIAADMLRAGGVKSALIDLGGNIYCVGAKQDGSLWRVALRDPAGEGYLGVVAVSDCAVVSSGCYERYFEKDGVRYGHIFDPATGRPADNGLISVTVIGKSGAECDALSTALYVMGPEKAAGFLAGQDAVDAVLVREDGTLIITEGLADVFTPMGAYAQSDIEWVK